MLKEPVGTSPSSPAVGGVVGGLEREFDWEMIFMMPGAVVNMIDSQ